MTFDFRANKNNSFLKELFNTGNYVRHV